MAILLTSQGCARACVAEAFAMTIPDTAHEKHSKDLLFSCAVPFRVSKDQNPTVSYCCAGFCDANIKHLLSLCVVQLCVRLAQEGAHSIALDLAEALVASVPCTSHVACLKSSTLSLNAGLWDSLCVLAPIARGV